MSPEQAAGKAADRRADIWSFGAVLYEMLSGSQAFPGESVSDTLASVLKLEPDWNALPASTPRPILELLRRCLTKDRKRRLQAIGEARIVLESSPQDEPAPHAEAGRVPSQIGWAAAAVLLIALSALAFVHFRVRPAPEPTLRYAIAVPENGNVHSFAISPDGRSVAIAVIANGKQQLWLRPLNALQPRLLPTTEDAAYPFWSPDSRYIGFFAQGKLKKIAAGGGPSQSICEADSARGASWSRDDVILFAHTGTVKAAIQRVPAAGGVPTDVDVGPGHRYPVFLPDGRRFLYYGFQRNTGDGLYVRSLDGDESRRLMADSSASVFAPASPGSHAGHLLFIRENNLMAIPFDAETAQAAGAVFPVAEGVSTSLANAGYAPVSVSENGVLVYSTGQTGGGTNQVAQYDRGGKFLGIVSEPGGVFMPAISADEKVMAYTRGTGGNFDIWLRDLARGTDTRFTAGGLNFGSAWSPKGDRLVFTSGGGGFGGLNIKAVSGSGEADSLLTANNVRSDQWSRDGRFIVFTRRDPKTREDLWVLPMDEAPSSDRKPKLFLQTEFNESQGQLSPDSRWMAYTSNESGERNVYVRAFPSADNKRRVSTAGGEQPRWRGDGKELFYIAPDGKMTGVIMKATPAAGLEPGAPTPLFDSHLNVTGNAGNLVFQYDVTADGKRFVVVETAGGGKSPPTLTAVVNWSSELKK
jgi:Tol biopolymer transport system component